MSKKLKHKIILLRKQGLSYREISKTLKCSRGSVSYHCSKLENDDKITKQNSNNHIKKEIQNIDDTTQKKIFLLYHFNISFSEIADALHLPIEMIKKCCKSFNIASYSELSNYEKVRLKRKKIKILAVIYKGGKCEKCGYNKCVEALSFHHDNPEEKEFTISYYSNASWSKIKKEIDKCTLLCVNCHSAIHANQQNNFIWNQFIQI